MTDASHKPLLTIDDLRVSFHTDEGVLRAVDGVSLAIGQGEVVGLVGESGCGKSVTAMSVLRLIPQPPGRVESGRILFEGQDLLTLPIEALRRVRGARIGMIFQDAMTSLSPLKSIGRQLVETLQLHRAISFQDAWKESARWLEQVGFAEASARLSDYPFQFSGGMRQRVMIAMAMMLQPSLLIADEPTTALDVTVQAQIFDLMMEMRSRSTSILLITHDMGVVQERCDRVLVMYAGRIVEEAANAAIFTAPRHPYTQGLLRSIPAQQVRGARLETIPGQVPSLLHPPKGCRFADRCPFAYDRCRHEDPPLFTVGLARRAACFLHDPAGSQSPHATKG